MYHRTKNNKNESNRKIFLRSVDWKVGQYYTAIRNAGVCFMLPLIFSVDKMQLTGFSSCFDFKLIIMGLRSKDPILSQYIYRFQICTLLLEGFWSTYCHHDDELLISICFCLFCILIVALFFSSHLKYEVE